MKINAYFTASCVAEQEFDPADYLFCECEDDVLEALFEDFRTPCVPYTQGSTFYIDSMEELSEGPELDNFLKEWRKLKDAEENE